MLDRAWLSLLVRVPASLALAGLLMHAGMHVAARDALPFPGHLVAFVALAAVLAVAASWATARLQAKRAALVATMVLLGAGPLAALAVHAGDAVHVPGFWGVLAFAAANGALVLLFGALFLAKPAPGAARRESADA